MLFITMRFPFDRRSDRVTVHLTESPSEDDLVVGETLNDEVAGVIMQTARQIAWGLNHKATFVGFESQLTEEQRPHCESITGRVLNHLQTLQQQARSVSAA